VIASLSALPTVFSIGLQRQLAYRWNYLLRALFSAMPLLVSWVFWSAVFEGKSTVGSYTLASLLTYYAVLLIVESVSSPADDDFQISREIREGTLNSILLRPLPYGLYRAALFLSGRCAYLVAAQAQGEKLSGTTVKITQKAGVDGRLFGSVTNFDIAEELVKSGYTVSKAQIRMPNGPIKIVGDSEVSVALHTDVLVDIKVSVYGETA
jgi:hypothetical protein